MKTNEQIQQDVEDAIKWEPLLRAAEIGVIVRNGIVTLTGTVDNYAKKMEAERAAKNVAGVKAIVEKIEVRLPHTGESADEHLAESALEALRNAWSVDEEKIKVKVQNGWVYLEGDLPWNYQKESAENAVNKIPGLKGLVNNIAIKSYSRDKMEQRLIEDALKRHWSINSDLISVKVSGTNVTLTGVVHSLYEKEEAARIAWKTPGVWSVDNNLTVEYKFAMA